MKHLKSLFICIISLMPIRVMAHGGPEELGHHWQSHAYIGEIHFQLGMMAVLTLAIIAAGKLMQKRKADR
ncbi:hypothetical protein LLG46_13355 [bacterium]|nr:hypothetical protein [bacterium]